MSLRRAAPCLLAVGLLAAGACQTVPTLRRVEPAPAADCFDARFRGHFDAAEDGKGPRFVRLALRGCEDGRGPVVFELRGRVGGTALAGAVGGGRMLLLYPGDRRALSAPDTRAVWRRWAGVPVEESLFRRALLSARGVEGRAQVGAWSVEVERIGGDRVVVNAWSSRGDALTLELADHRSLDGMPAWPEVPSSFETLDVAEDGEVRR